MDYSRWGGPWAVGRGPWAVSRGPMATTLLRGNSRWMSKSSNGASITRAKPILTFLRFLRGDVLKLKPRRQKMS